MKARRCVAAARLRVMKPENEMNREDAKDAKIIFP
jgi:hypothetical protein